MASEDNDLDRAIWDSGYNQGKADGEKEARIKILGYLQRKYMVMSIPADDPTMVATIDLVGEIAREFNVGN